MINKNQKIEKLINIYYKISYILEFILSIPFSIFLLILKYNKEHTGVWFLSNLIPTTIFAIALITIAITQIIRYRDKIERMFLTFAIPIGMMYAIYMIPTFVPDENVHLYRAYQISIGNFIEKRENQNDASVEIPTNIYESTIDNNRETKYGDVYSNIFGNNDYSKTTSVQNYAQNYCPILYIFSSFGLFIGRIMQLNPYITLYLAKIFNFISFLVLGYYTIKKIPFGKLLVLAYFMMPMMLHQATSISADSLSNSVPLFFIAYTLQLLKRKETMNLKEEILYYFLIAVIAVAKTVYMPLAFLSLLFIGNNNYSKTKKTRIILISTITSVVISAGWYMFGMISYPDPRGYISEHGINGTEQIKYILSNPIEYAKVLYHTLDEKLESYVFSLVGSNLGWLNIGVKTITITGFIVLVVGAPFLSKHEKTLNNKERLWIGLIFLGTVLFILTALYVGWTSVGSGMVEGIQGRYFIPIVILPLLCLCIKEKYIEFKYINVIYPILLCYLNSSAIDSIIRFFM